MAPKPISSETQSLLPRATIRSPSRIYLAVAFVLAAGTVGSCAAVYKYDDDVPRWAPIIPAGLTLAWIFKGFWDSRTVYQLRVLTPAGSSIDLENPPVAVNGDTMGTVAVQQVRVTQDETAIQAQITEAKRPLLDQLAKLQRELAATNGLLVAANQEKLRLKKVEEEAAKLKEQNGQLAGAEAARKASESNIATLEQELQRKTTALQEAKNEAQRLEELAQQVPSLTQQIEQFKAELQAAQTKPNLTDEEESLLQELNGIFDEYLASFPEDGTGASTQESEPGPTPLATELLKILGKADVVKTKLEAFIQSRIDFITALRTAGGTDLQNADDAAVIASIQRDPTPLQSPAVKASLGIYIAKSPVNSRPSSPSASPAKMTPRRKATPLSPYQLNGASPSQPFIPSAVASVPPTLSAPNPSLPSLPSTPPQPKQKSPARNLTPTFLAEPLNGTNGS